MPEGKNDLAFRLSGFPALRLVLYGTLRRAMTRYSASTRIAPTIDINHPAFTAGMAGFFALDGGVKTTIMALDTNL